MSDALNKIEIKPVAPRDTYTGASMASSIKKIPVPTMQEVSESTDTKKSFLAKAWEGTQNLYKDATKGIREKREAKRQAAWDKDIEEHKASKVKVEDDSWVDSPDRKYKSADHWSREQPHRFDTLKRYQWLEDTYGDVTDPEIKNYYLETMHKLYNEDQENLNEFKDYDFGGPKEEFTKGNTQYPSQLLMDTGLIQTGRTTGDEVLVSGEKEQGWGDRFKALNTKVKEWLPKAEKLTEEQRKAYVLADQGVNPMSQPDFVAEQAQYVNYKPGQLSGLLKKAAPNKGFFTKETRQF